MPQAQRKNKSLYTTTNPPKAPVAPDILLLARPSDLRTAVASLVEDGARVVIKPHGEADVVRAVDGGGY